MHPSQTDWANDVRRGARPSADALRAHLLAVHRANAGFTESCARRCRDGTGRSTYAWLADLVPPGAEVLDLACGSGPLLAEILGRDVDARLTGVDMSVDELSLARQRVGRGVALHEGLAQDLSRFAPESFDLVLCHWALTLMDPVAPVLAEVHRVLRPGGRFAAIVDGEMGADAGYRAAHDVIYGWVRRELPHYGTFDLGDPRVRTAKSLRALAEDVFGAQAVSVEAGVFSLSDAADRLAQEAAGFFYASFVLSPAARKNMLAELAQQLAARGTARFALPVNRLVAQKAAAPHG